jgi:hypothetical protein
MTSIERLVPVPAMPADSAAVFSEIRTTEQPSLALRNAVRMGKVPASDLPEIIANIWTWDDSPTSDLGEADWVEIFRAAGFFRIRRSWSGSPTAPRSRWRVPTPR